MMKQIIILLIGLGILSFSGCDKIEGPYRENPGELQSTVTLFEFTGIQCVNCPTAHEVLEELQNQFGDKLQVIGVHPDEFGQPIDGFILRTKLGQELATITKTSGLPKGCVNMLSEGSGSQATQWAEQISSAGSLAPILTLEASLLYQEKDSTLNATINGEFDEFIGDYQGEIVLAVYLIEKEIEGPQLKVNVGKIEDYKHKHVLRSTFNGSIGEFLVKNPTKGTKIDKINYSLKVPLKPVWNIENLEVVVFVYDNETKKGIPFTVTYKN